MTQGDRYSDRPMHQYLRAWRLHRKLTLEKVAAHLGVKHSTISRWESGDVPVNSKNIAELASLYGCTEMQLVGGTPSQAEVVKRIEEVEQILEAMAPGDREHWLATGRALGRRP